MTLFRCIRAEADGELWAVLAVANLAGLVNVLSLACIEAGVQTPSDHPGRTLAALLGLVVVNVVCSRHVKRRLSAWIEAVLYRVRVRVGERVARAELSALEQVAPAELFESVGESTARISGQAGLIGALMQSCVILGFVALYAAWLSLAALTLLGGVCAVAVALFLGSWRDMDRQQRRIEALGAALVAKVTALLADRERLRSSRREGWQARADVVAAAEELRAAERRANDSHGDGLLLGEATLFVLAAAVAYSLHATGVDARTLAHLFAAVMFVWGPVMEVVGGVAPYLQANETLARIDRLERRLAVDKSERDDPWRGRARRFVAAGVVGDDGRREVGPVDLAVAAGEVVAITGGEEGGASALVRLLTGLATPGAGALVVDGVVVGAGNVAAFCELVAVVVPGPGGSGWIPPGRAAEAARWLERLGLSARVGVADGAFTTGALSTGERGRLALIVALLADRPICVFAEWDADQDPAGRRLFVEEVLPGLRAGGKLVIVVSRDEQVVAAADSVVRLGGGAR